MGSPVRRVLERAISFVEHGCGITLTMVLICGMFLNTNIDINSPAHRTREFKSAVTIEDTISWGNGINR
jgi:hypothetical protein